MKKIIAAALLAGTALAPASATTVNFADYAAGTAMTNQVSGLGFALTGGPGADGAPIVSYGWHDSVRSLNNTQILSDDGYPTSKYLTFSFANTASAVSFTYNNYGNYNGANYKAFDANDALISSGDISSLNSFDLVNVAGAGISKLVLDNGGGNWVFGVGQLSFNAAVPEAGTWAMMIGGFALAGAAMRRRKTAVSFA